MDADAERPEGYPDEVRPERTTDRAPIVWFSDMPVDFHNPEPRHKIAGLREAGHSVLVVDQLGVANPGPRNAGKLARYAARTVRAGRPSTGGDDVAQHGEKGLQLVIVPPRHHAWSDRLNQRLLRVQLNRAIRRAALDRPVLWYRFPSPELVRLADCLDPRLVIYECLDRYARWPYPRRARSALVRAEDQLLGRADLVIVTSEGLRAHASRISGRVCLHPHATQVARFSGPPPPPADMACLPRPWIGYSGPLDARLDIGLLARIAEQHPTASLVIVGPVTSAGDVARAGRIPNLHILGARPHGEMPAYVGGFDLGILPYGPGPWVDDGFPVKGLEYLAAGIPVVSVDMPEFRSFGHVAAIASDREGFLAAVAEALAGRPVATPPARRAAVRDADWAVRNSQLVALVDSALASASRPADPSERPPTTGLRA